MRPTAKRQSALHAPLNTILGTEAAVRVLRVLALNEDPLSRGEIAGRSGLHMSGIPRVVATLERQGVAESVGQGHSRPIRLRQAHPLYQHLRQLFNEERKNAQDVLDGIKSEVNALQPIPVAAWIEGPVATGTDRYEDPIIVGVLADAAGSEAWNDQLRRQFTNLQRQRDVAIEVHIWWRANVMAVGDAERATLTTAIPLLGPHPVDLFDLDDAHADTDDAERRGTHAMHDATARRFAGAIAKHLKAKPSLVADTRRSLERRIPAASAHEALELQEWHDILSSYSPSRLRDFLMSDSERAVRLRQSLPFLHVLSNDERRTLRRAAELEPQ